MKRKFIVGSDGFWSGNWMQMERIGSTIFILDEVLNILLTCKCDQLHPCSGGSFAHNATIEQVESNNGYTLYELTGKTINLEFADSDLFDGWPIHPVKYRIWVPEQEQTNETKT